MRRTMFAILILISICGGALLRAQTQDSYATSNSERISNANAGRISNAVQTAAQHLREWRLSRVKLADDWGELERYRADNKRLAALPADHERVVFFGDSITDYWELEQFFPGKPYVNRGISGQTTPQMLVRFREDVIDLHPRAVVILAGTNDIAGNTGPESDDEIKNNLASMADLGKANNVRVILASILPVHNFTPTSQDFFYARPPERIVALNKWLKDYCTAKGLTYIDYYGAMVGTDGLLRRELAEDGLHPNEIGYRIMTKIVNEELKNSIATTNRKKAEASN